MAQWPSQEYRSSWGARLASEQRQYRPPECSYRLPERRSNSHRWAVHTWMSATNMSMTPPAWNGSVWTTAAAHFAIEWNVCTDARVHRNVKTPNMCIQMTKCENTKQTQDTCLHTHQNVEQTQNAHSQTHSDLQKACVRTQIMSPSQTIWVMLRLVAQRA